jgi:hypothetical protein
MSVPSLPGIGQQQLLTFTIVFRRSQWPSGKCYVYSSVLFVLLTSKKSISVKALPAWEKKSLLLSHTFFFLDNYNLLFV